VHSKDLLIINVDPFEIPSEEFDSSTTWQAPKPLPLVTLTKSLSNHKVTLTLSYLKAQAIIQPVAKVRTN